LFAHRGMPNLVGKDEPGEAGRKLKLDLLPPLFLIEN
jgi:hypothetical protein